MAGITAALIVGGATLGAAGIGAASQAGWFGGRGGGGGAMDKKWIRRANQTSDEAYRRSQAAISDMIQRVNQAGSTYRTNVTNFSNTFNQKMGAAQNEFKGVSDAAIMNQGAINADYLRRAEAVPEESADQALRWNEANQTRMIAFADAIQAASARSMKDSWITPEMQKTIDQLTLNTQADARGILSTDVMAQIARGSAGTALASGVQGDMRNNLTLRDIGLTSVARQDAAVANTAQMYNSIFNPMMQASKVDYDSIVKSFLMDGNAVANLRSGALTNWLNTGIGIEDNRRTDGARVLQSRETQYTYDYGQLANMEGSIYSGAVNTYNNAANLGVSAAATWGNQRLGIQATQAQAANAANIAAAENSTALTVAGLNSISSMAGAYYARNQTPAATTPTTGTTTPAGATTSTAARPVT